jgi:hypothetical protein
MSASSADTWRWRLQTGRDASIAVKGSTRMNMGKLAVKIVLLGDGATKRN